MYPQIVFNANQTFGLVLNKIKAICCVLFDKIEGSLQKHHILENIEFEKLSHFLNLLDFELLSQQVLSRIVV